MLYLFFLIIFLFNFALVFTGCKNDIYDRVSISLSESEIEIVLGDKELKTVDATISGSNSISGLSFFSSDNEVVVIDHIETVGDKTSRAYFKALAPGRAKIIARTSEGNKTAILNVNVTLPIENVNFKDNKYFLLLGDKSESLSFTSLDFIFSPSNTSQKDLIYSFSFYENEISKNEQASISSDMVRISENGVLTVSNNLPKKIKTILVTAESKYNKEIITSTNVSIFHKLSSSETVITDVNNVVISNDKNIAEVELLKNKGVTYSVKYIKVKVPNNNSDLVFKIFDLKNNLNEGIVDFEIVDSSVEGDNKVYTCKLSCIDIGNVSVKLSLYNNEYKFYDEIASINVYCNNLIDKILINGEDYSDKDINSCKIIAFNSYTGGVKGTEIIIGTNPLNYSRNYSGLYLKAIDDFFDNVEVYQNGVKLVSNENGLIPIDKGSIFVKGKNISGEFKFVICTNFTGAYESIEDVSQQVNVLIMQGITELSVEKYNFNDSNISQIYSNTYELNMALKGETCERYFRLKVNDGAYINDISVISDNKKIIITKVDDLVYKVSSGVNCKGQIIIKPNSGNTNNVYLNVNIIKELENVDISASTGNEVGKYVEVDKNIKYIAIDYGKTIKLNLHNYPYNVNYDSINYYYCDIDEDLTDVDFNKYAYVNKSDRLIVENNLIRTFGIGTTLVKVVINYEYVSNDGQILLSSESNQDNGKSIVKYFIITSYRQVNRVYFEKNYIELYERQNLGEYNVDESLFKASTRILFNPTTATIKDNPFILNYDKDYLDVYIENNQIFITAKNLSVFDYYDKDLTITVSYIEYEKVVSATLTVKLKKVQRSNSLVIYNLTSDEIYLDILNNRKYNLQCRLFPEDTFNKGIYFKYIPTVGSQDVITITENGEISVVGNKGGAGRIMICAMDSLVKIDNEWVVDINKTPAYYVDIFISDGNIGSEYFINNANDLISINEKGLDKNYIIKCDIDASMISTPIGFTNDGYIPFTGTINFASDKIKIYNLDIDPIVVDGKIYSGLFVKVGKEAVIKNLTIEYTQDSSKYNFTGEDIAYIGGLAAINEGLITNVDVKFNLDLTINLSGVFGGLVAINNGEIENCNISSTKSNISFINKDTNYNYDSAVGGLVGINFNSINNCNSYLNFEGEYQSNVGGVCGINYSVFEYENTISKIEEYNKLSENYTLSEEYTNEFNILKFIVKIINEQINLQTSQNISGYITKNVSYANILGRNNIGGVTGVNIAIIMDTSYEIEEENQSIKGNLNVGGLIGSNFGGLIRKSYSFRFIDNENISTLGVENKQNEGYYDIEGYNNVGGLIGFSKDSARILESFVNLSVYAKSENKINGGLIGYLLINDSYSFNISNSYSEVIGNDSMGGLIGSVVGYRINIYEENSVQKVEFTHNSSFNNLYLDYCYSVSFYQNSNTEEVIYRPIINKYDFSIKNFETCFYLGSENISNFGVNKTLEELQNILTYKEVGFDITERAFGSDATWFIYTGVINNSLPYLSYENSSILSKPISFAISLLKNNKIFTVDDSYKYLFGYFYDLKDNLVNNVSYINSLNKIKIEEFLSFSFEPYNSKTSLIFEVINPKNVVAKIEDNSTLTILDEGTFILKITSKFNKDLVWYTQVCINKAVGDMELFNALEYNENLEKLTENYLNYLKIGKNSPLYINNSDKKFKLTENLSFLIESSKTDGINDLNVVSSNGSNGNGLYNVTAVNKSYEAYLIISKLLNLKFYSNSEEDFKNNIFTGFDDNKSVLLDTQKLNYYIYNGVESITIDKDNSVIESGNSTSFIVTKVTDSNSQDSTNSSYAFNMLITNNDEIVFNNNFYFTKDIINKYFLIKEEKISETKVGPYFTISYRYTIALKDDIDARMFSSSKEFKIKIWSSSNSNLSASLILTVKPQEISSIKLDHFSSGLTTTNSNGDSVYYPQEQPSSIIAPGKNGILAINVYPYYSYFDYLEVVSESESGYKISFEQVTLDYINNSTIFVSSDSQIIDGGIKLNKISSNINGNKSYNGNIYVRTLIPSSVDSETIFTISVRPYRDGKLIEDKVVTMLLQSAYISKANISAEDEESKNIALGVDSKIYLTLEDKDAEFEAPIAYNTETIGDEVQGEVARVSISPSGEVKFVNGLYVYEYTVYPYLDCKQSKVKINVNSWKIVNNIKEVTTQSMYLYIKDFLVKDIFLKDEVDNEFSLYYGIEKKIELDVIFSDAPYNKTGASEYNKKIDEIASKKQEFKEFLNKVLIEKIMYYQTDDGNYSLVSSFNDKFKFVVINELDSSGKVVDYTYNLLSLNNVNCNFRIINNLEDKYYDLSEQDLLKYNEFKKYLYKNIEHDIYIKVKTYSDENTPIAITTVEELYTMKEGEYYILLPNESLNGVFEISNHTPLNVNIGGLDGNGKIIKIKSFDTSYSSNYFGFFENIYKNSLIKNLTIDISDLEEIDFSDKDSITFGTLAGKNDGGIITNCEIISTKSSGSELVINTSEYLYNNGSYTKTNIFIAGLVGINNGSLTNSRFGGYGTSILYNYNSNSKTTIETAYNKYQITIKASGNVAGVCANNNGIISSCYFYNSSIITNNSINNIVSGFVLNNNTNASIYLSYSKGEYNLNNVDVRYQDKGIESYGLIAGFVYQNNGNIADCYSNIPIYSNGNKSAGFVFSNQTSGTISRCYSACKTVTKNQTGFATLQNAFVGTNDLGSELLNKGKIENCYFYYYYNSETEETENFLELDEEIISKYGQNMAIGINSSMFTIESSFNGFAINKKIPNSKSVWYMTSSGPELVSPNLETKSVRYIKELNGVTYMPYLDDFKYGTSINPILITTAEEFNKVLNPASDSIYSDYYSNGKVFGNYRLVYNISFSSIKQEEDIENDEQNIDPELNKDQIKLETTNIELTTVKNAKGTIYEGTLDGNGLEISGIEINTFQDTNNQSIGLFSKITNGAVVKNLNLKITNGSANSYSFVGGLAGIIDSSIIINVKIDDGTNDKTAVIMGLNSVGGLAGKVIGESYLYNISSDISVRSTKEVEGYIDYSITKNNQALQKEISYAGGIAGIYDFYSEDFTNFISNANASITASKLYVYGNILIQGNVVGGLFGYIGDQTYIKNAIFEVYYKDENITKNQTIVCTGSYAGGIAGVNKGKIENVTVEHSEKVQNVIDEIVDGNESLINKYFNNNMNLSDSDKLKLGNTNLFTNYGDKNIIAIGGLIGNNDNGIIYTSYAKVDVTSIYARYAGGITGYNSQGKYYQVFASGDVYSSEYIGGIIGYVDNSTTMPILNVVTAANFYKKWNNDKYVITIENTDARYNEYVKKYTDLIEFADENGTSYTTFIKIYPIGYNYVYNESGAKKSTDTSSLIKEVYAINKLEFLSKNLSSQGTLEKFSSSSTIGQFKLSDIKNPNDSTNKLKLNTYLALGDQNFVYTSWIRNVNQIFPELLFKTNLFNYYIDTYEDFDNIILDPNGSYMLRGIKYEASNPNEVFNLLNNEVKKQLKEGHYYIVLPNVQDSGIIFSTALTFTGSLVGKTYRVNNEICYPTIIGFNNSGSKSSSVGLFNLSDGALFKDFNIESFSLTSQTKNVNSYASLLVSKAVNTSFKNITISNCELTSSAQYTGMLTGYASGGNFIEDITIINPTLNLYTNNDLASAYYYGGQIIGFVSDIEKVSNLKLNNGNILIRNNNILTNINVGMLFGAINQIKLDINPNLNQNNYITGKIDAYNNDHINIGGLVGLSTGSDTIQNVFASIHIDSHSNNTNLGGVVGQANQIKISSVYLGKFGTTLDGANSYNIEPISSADDKVSYNIGGIIGYGKASLENNNIEAKINSIVSNSNVSIGGLAGYLNSESNINNCYFVGNISSTNAKINTVGGFAGTISGGANIKNNIFTGDITVSGNDTGNKNLAGVIGNILDNNSYIIESNTLVGKISSRFSKSYVSSIVGFTKSQNLTISDNNIALIFDTLKYYDSNIFVSNIENFTAKGNNYSSHLSQFTYTKYTTENTNYVYNEEFIKLIKKGLQSKANNKYIQNVGSIYETSGNILNPIKISNKNSFNNEVSKEENANKILLLTKNIEDIDVVKGLTLKSFLLGGGHTITVTSDNFKSTSVLFNTINDGAILSGINVKFTITQEISNTLP